MMRGDYKRKDPQLRTKRHSGVGIYGRLDEVMEREGKGLLCRHDSRARLGEALRRMKEDVARRLVADFRQLRKEGRALLLKR